MYNPDGYNMHSITNVYDKVNQGKPKFVFFFPGYVNRKGCYNKDGVSDVTKALIEILLNRHRVKYNSSDPNTIIKTIAEIPITPAEAIIKLGVNMFPIADLTERLEQLDANPSEFDNVYVGNLIFDSSNQLVFKPSTAQPIRDFPHKDNKIEGAIEIFEMPEIDKKTGKPYTNRYIFGCLTKGEKVNTQRGLVKVEDINLNDKLINIEGKEVSIYNIQQYYNENPVYKIKLSGIYNTTTFSEEHPIYCCTPKIKWHNSKYARVHGLHQRYKIYNFQFKPVKDLAVGDYIKAPLLYTEEKDLFYLWDDDRQIDYKTINPLNNYRFWYLVGVILGDGWIGNTYKTHICFNKKEKQLIDFCRDIVENVLFRKFIKEKERDSIYEYSFCCKPFVRFFTTYFGKYAEGKYINECLKYLPYESKKNLILGYIDTDGCVRTDDTGIEIVSISNRLLCDIQDILFSLGIVSSMKCLRKEGVHRIAKKDCKTKKTYQLHIGKCDTKKIKNWNIPSMKVGNYQIKGIAIEKRIKDCFIKDNYLYIKVKNITILPYVGPVYNFECDTHTFMCNYIPTHNCDPVDQDQSNTMSLGSVFGLDLWTDRIVVEYTGRSMFSDDFYEIVRKLGLFYNGKINYENNLKGLFSYFSARNCLYLLSDVLEFLKDKQLMREGIGNLSKGTRATLPINNYGRERLRSWLLSPVPIVRHVNGEDVEDVQARLYTLRNRALIKELINYNNVGNFDRISAMGMLMLLREDRMILYQGDMSKGKDISTSTSYLGNDEFFTKNYPKRN